MLGAIIVLYHPDPDTLSKSVQMLAGQVEYLILVDNSNSVIDNNFIERLQSLFKNKIHYFFNRNEGGIARAQNVGLKLAIEAGCEQLLILDQDSIPEGNLIDILLCDVNFLKNKGFKISAIGPNPINKQTGTEYKERSRKRKSFTTEHPEILNVSEIMSSGMFIHKDVLSEVGFMDEILFIDGVDHEWCWRANYYGYTCALTKKTQLQHMLGDGDKKIIGIRIAYTSVFRIYYQYRNYIYLLSKNYVPLFWKLKNGFKYLIKIFYYPIIAKDGKKYLTNMFRGIKDGVSLR